MGPLLSTAGGPAEPLAWLVNQAATGVMPDMAQLLARGESVYLPQIYARRPRPEDNLAAARLFWHALTGRELGDDLYVIGVDFIDDELVVPRSTLRAVLDRLTELRRQAPKPEGPWLFRRDPLWNEPAACEDEALRELEVRASELDQLEAARESGAAGGDALEVAAEVAVKRQFLLRDLEAAGLLADAFAPVKLHYLRLWSLPVLAGYTASAEQLHRYLRGAERRGLLPEERHNSPLDAWVSLDWFRRGQAPPAESAHFYRLALCERALREAPPVEGYSGEVFTRLGGELVRLEWRRDNGVMPALLRAAQMRDGVAENSW